MAYLQRYPVIVKSINNFVSAPQSEKNGDYEDFVFSAGFLLIFSVSLFYYIFFVWVFEIEDNIIC